MAITASIVTYKTDRVELETCLKSLIRGGIAHIYVVDNSPTDDLRAFCTGFDQVQYHFCGKNLGYGAGHNIAIRQARSAECTYHLVVNTDIYFDADVLSCLEAYMDANTDVALCQPRVFSPDGNQQYCRRLPDPFTLFVRRFLPKCLARTVNSRYEVAPACHDVAIDVPYLQGSFMLFRRSHLEEVGLFDERYFMYPEDIDITRRLHAIHRTMYVPFAQIVHAHRRASYKSMKMLLIHACNMVTYFNKWGWFVDPDRKRWNKALRNLSHRASQQ